jgi:hypothetical protein
VRVLLDEQLPRQLTAHIVGHDVATVQQQGWAGLTNGELLTQAAAAGFDALVTADQSLQFQQNLKGSRLLVVVLIARSNALEDLLPTVSELLTELTNAQPGRIVRVRAAQ